jgi:predicted nuclease of predicted toxin-antitoxin system
MRLLLDECAGDRKLLIAFAAAGHDVVRSVDILGSGAEDSAVFAFACKDDRVLITFNGQDFIALARREPTHPGLLLIYRDSRQKDLPASDLVKAVINVEATEPLGIKGRIIGLNQYCW